MFVHHMSDQGLVSRIYEKFLQFSKKRQQLKNEKKF